MQIDTYQSRILMSCWIDSQKRGFTPRWTLLWDTTKSGWLLVMSIKWHVSHPLWYLQMASPTFRPY